MAFAKLSGALLACNDARLSAMPPPELPPRLAPTALATDTHKLLVHHFKALKLPAFLREYDGLARQCAAEGLDYSGFLLRLAEQEVIERNRLLAEKRIREAQFPAL